ncbi:hypothetical protein [Aeromonas caviae]|uniref:hypothetical protein n=1 Tax=Aeromonas caviae TaxID=648 RepID=UPI003F744381
MTQHFIIGDHLVARLPDGDQHGLFVDHDQVICYLARADDNGAGQLVLTSLVTFRQHSAIEAKPHSHRLFSREESLTRAYTQLSERELDQPFSNGEQFVTWCIEGLRNSSNLVPTVVASVVAAEVARHTLGKAATTTAAGIAATTLTATTTGGTVTATVMASAASVVSAPILAPLAVGAVAVYSVAKLWDWLSD